MMTIPYIGRIKSRFDKPADPNVMREAESEIEIFEAYAEGLFKTELSQYIEVFFRFDRAEPVQMKTYTFTGDYKGIFATRSPRRPSQIGNTPVKLLERKGRFLKVKGLDALNGTPVIDIKPVHIPLSDEDLKGSEFMVRKMNPRKLIYSNIWAGNTKRLLLDAGQLHGHFCTGLAMGVMMAVKGMQWIRGRSDGLEDLLAIVETNNCAADGIQYVTGCTLGNNALIFKDYGKTAFTLTRRDGKGIRISARADAKTYIHTASPLFAEIYDKVVGQHIRKDEEVAQFKKLGVEKAFALLGLDFDKLFKTETVDVAIPSYAPSYESIVCEKCGEAVMRTRIINKNGKNLCIPCAGKTGMMLSGDGIAEE